MIIGRFFSVIGTLRPLLGFLWSSLDSSYELIISFLMGRPLEHPWGIVFHDKQKPFKAPG